MESMPKNKELTIEKSMADFKSAYRAKRKLIEREREDFLFALGKQWSDEDAKKLESVGIKPITDNRIQPNIFLLTGLERQNRTEFKAFPEGEEDGLKADIATALFKHAIKISDFGFKSSDQFKDGVTCGESHLEPYLDRTRSLINARPCWKKCDGNMIFPEPGCREYDYSDARYIYKLTVDVSMDDLISLYPEKRKKIEEAESGKLELDVAQGGEKHRQKRDYGKDGEVPDCPREDGFDLVERFYKKFVEKVFIGDKQTGEIKEAEDLDRAQGFVDDYRAGIDKENFDYVNALEQFRLSQVTQVDPVTGVTIPTPYVEQPEPPTQKNADRFIIIKRNVPEIWMYAHVQGIDEPLADERAWFYPKWKSYPFVPFFARFSTAPITGDDRHLLVQGIVNPVKGVQEKHNKAEMLMLRHLNTATNSGWLSEEDAWVDRAAAKKFGTEAGVNLEYKKGSQKPERIFPMPLSQGHAQIAMDSAEAIKSQLGMNSDLIAAQQGGGDSGRAIALRQRQGLLMVQELFDNLSRSRKIAGRFLLSQLGEIYDTETAKKVLGEAFLAKNFPPLMLKNTETGQDEPMKEPTGEPMAYDKEMAEVAIAEVLSGDLEEYDVSVGETVASETMQLARAAEVKEIAASLPGIVPPEVLINESQLSESTKNSIRSAIQNAQAQQAAMASRVQAPHAIVPQEPVAA
jgi:hypothetical protein